MVEWLIILALWVGHFPVFDCTEVCRLVVPKNLKSVYTCESGSFGCIVDFKIKVQHVHEAIIEQIQTVCVIGTHGFQMPLVCPKCVGWGNMIPEVAPGDWAIEILEVQIPIYAPMCPLLGGVGHNNDSYEDGTSISREPR